MHEETEVLGENLRGQVWIENQIHIRLWPDWEIEPGPHWWKAREQPLRQPARTFCLAAKTLRNWVKDSGYPFAL